MQILHYTTAAGRAPVRDFIREILELRVKDGRGRARVFSYAKVKQTIFPVRAVRKKSRTISDKDRGLTVKRVKEINQRYRG